MTVPCPEMIDAVFEASGEALPPSYPYALWDAIARLVPQLGEGAQVGVIPMRLAESEGRLLLPKRARLALRIPRELADAAARLARQTLQIAGSELLLGNCSVRPLQPYSTLHAQLVSGPDDEIAFVAEVQAALAALGVSAKLICGQRQALVDGARVISGSSLVLHDLTPEASLLVQCVGLGEGRRFGCGIFVPYKVISGLE